ncbi:MAG: M15 family metallopeptidase [Abditibacteriota bacterium]|nr:M15 family metallopeptidase [Abditibacteriota bacterium]
MCYNTYGDHASDGALLPQEKQMQNAIEKGVMDPSGFVLLADYVPGIIQEIRYYSTYNFIGDRIDGYEEPCAILTIEAARALKEVSMELFVRGYRLKVYDAYRPACAVKQFTLWGIEDQDIRMKPYFYPELEKEELFSRGYIAKRSSHSRGSAVDLTLFDMQTGKEVDMGGPFDFFGGLSHPDCRDVTHEQYQNRMTLQRVMVRYGFAPYECEWWHFRLDGEPYPDTYFEFPVSSAYLKK